MGLPYHVKDKQGTFLRHTHKASEVGCLHTNRLESLKHIFQPSTNFLLTNYSFGKLVRTSTLCMTQVIFPTIVYRQIISLIIIIHCITIPVGQKFTYTKLTVPLNSLENDVMGLEASDRLIDII